MLPELPTILLNLRQFWQLIRDCQVCSHIA
jgi:hypothetical protein